MEFDLAVSYSTFDHTLEAERLENFQLDKSLCLEVYYNLNIVPLINQSAKKFFRTKESHWTGRFGDAL